MNATVFKALFLDALYQVLDNKVFRILAVLTLLPIAFTFLVMFEDDRISVLFGVWDLPYSDLLNSFGGLGVTQEEIKDLGLRESLIQGLQATIVERLSGTLGLMMSIAATAFFVPRMLERGTADTLFSKPVSRSALLLARYAAGLIFVAVLSVVLVFGMHIGFTLVSGYSDPGFLWGALTLVYVFALVHSVSVAVAAITRSSIAAILISLMLFAFGGCVHPLWIEKERSAASEELSYQREVKAAQEAGEELPEREERSPVLPLVLDALHYPLPKTTDAAILTQKLRRRVESRNDTFEDPYGDLQIGRPRAQRLELRFRLEAPPAHTEHFSEGTYLGSKEGIDKPPIQVHIRRISAEFEPPPEVGAEAVRRPKPLSRSRYVRAEVEEIEKRADEGQVTTEISSSPLGNLPQSVLRWSEGDKEYQRNVFRYLEQIYEIEFEFEPEFEGRVLDAEERWKVADSFENSMLIPELKEQTGVDQGSAWYAKQLSFTAPLKFNILFSVGSSLAFLTLMLGLAIWRVRRIDF